MSGKARETMCFLTAGSLWYCLWVQFWLLLMMLFFSCTGGQGQSSIGSVCGRKFLLSITITRGLCLFQEKDLQTCKPANPFGNSVNRNPLSLSHFCSFSVSNIFPFFFKQNACWDQLNGCGLFRKGPQGGKTRLGPMDLFFKTKS